jgi:hypothetical protein
MKVSEMAKHIVHKKELTTEYIYVLNLKGIPYLPEVLTVLP